MTCRFILITTIDRQIVFERLKDSCLSLASLSEDTYIFESKLSVNDIAAVMASEINRLKLFYLLPLGKGKAFSIGKPDILNYLSYLFPATELKNWPNG